MGLQISLGFQQRLIFLVVLGMTMKLVPVGIRPNPSRFWRGIPELTGCGFGNYPTFLIGVGDNDVTPRPIPIPVPASMIKLLKFY